MELKPGQVVIDGTVGSAGHAREFLKQVLPGGFLLGFDQDPQIAEFAARELESAGFTRGEQFEVEVRRFSTIDEALARRRTRDFDRFFADLGVCSLHFDRPERGFSFRHEGPLDMRLNPEEPGSSSAAQIVNEAEVPGLEKVFAQYGEERWARKIAQAIGRARQAKLIRTTTELREIVASAIPRRAWPPKTDPATRVFQALRIVVNRELEEVEEVLAKLPRLMQPGSRAAFITFHSLEDRLVKTAFRDWSRECICPPELPVCRCGKVREFREVTRKPVTADPKEIGENPRSRSAKLRAVEKLAV
jgi:16S rRNA (cytosine1402-N4)-methyltransferase